MFSRENKKNNSKVGKIGEDIFVKHLVKHKYSILDRNFRKNWGEIDVVAKKDGIIHFFEVKSVKKNGFFDMFHMKPRTTIRHCSLCAYKETTKIVPNLFCCCEAVNSFSGSKNSTVPYCDHGVKQLDVHDPLENIHAWKRRRFSKTIESYLQEKNVSYETEWQVNAGAVFLDFKNKRAKIKIIKDIDVNS